ncbi:MAG: hypothetical protein N2205_03210 [Candidatus Caldatribacterium sp.]|uniref:hypothetical protein n=1 Tax=Candidatus Caldatribacterium sp. TaxID=2282143 RepID=UPI00299822BF|nr:hypothetical protein [Candidatus Caldatribacterium sp.]MCX7730215.1 hypothetical protein [Candidatus Caldatribacterium sp.]MDW8080775.1 hypothetical protein [Candidatus Calescibacterium sp.]
MELLKSSRILEEVLATSDVFVFCGPGGTGKSEMAANFSAFLGKRGMSCVLVDLDFSKGDFTLRSPRFRTPCPLFPQGVRASYVETPLFTRDLVALFSRMEESLRLVIDLGRDEKGLRLFRSLRPFWEKRNTHVALVVNFARPFFENVASYAGFVEDMQGRYGIPFASLVANTHLVGETTVCLLKEGWERAKILGRTLGLPVLFASLWEKKKDYYSLIDWQESAVLAVSRFLVLPWGEEDESWFERG